MKKAINYSKTNRLIRIRNSRRPVRLPFGHAVELGCVYRRGDRVFIDCHSIPGERHGLTLAQGRKLAEYLLDLCKEDTQ